MNINVASPQRGRLFYGKYRSQRAEEARRRQLQLAAIGVAFVVAALLSVSLCVARPALRAPQRAQALMHAPRTAASPGCSGTGGRAGARSPRLWSVRMAGT